MKPTLDRLPANSLGLRQASISEEGGDVVRYTRAVGRRDWDLEPGGRSVKDRRSSAVGPVRAHYARTVN